ncbi:GTP cyclohydrolase 1 [subsurface metagenome]
MYEELLVGQSERCNFSVTTFSAGEYDEVILLKDIPIYSLCEHHLLPFIGRAHVAYIPVAKVIGLSKLGRIVERYARRLQIQERLTIQIADELETLLKPLGVVIVIEAEHLCMAMRGLSKPGMKTITSCVKGIFRDDVAARAEVMRLIKGT